MVSSQAKNKSSKSRSQADSRVVSIYQSLFILMTAGGARREAGHEQQRRIIFNSRVSFLSPSNADMTTSDSYALFLPAVLHLCALCVLARPDNVILILTDDQDSTKTGFVSARVETHSFSLCRIFCRATRPYSRSLIDQKEPFFLVFTPISINLSDGVLPTNVYMALFTQTFMRPMPKITEIFMMLKPVKYLQSRIFKKGIGRV